MDSRRLIRTVFAPHHAVERQFERIRLATKDFTDGLKLRIGETQCAVKGLGATHETTLRVPVRASMRESRLLDLHVEETLEQHHAVGAAEQHRHRAFGVGHETDDVAGFVGHARDVVA